METLKYKIGICGHFGINKEFFDGQTVKTRTISDELKNIYGKDRIFIVDTNDWKRKPIKLLFNCYKLFKMCENIFILPAQNGIKVFSILFSILNKIYKRKIFYIVIGGWLIDLLEENRKLINLLSNFNTIYVEKKIMINDLNSLGLHNVKYLPNFKKYKNVNLEDINLEDINYCKNIPYKLCTFSRVIKEKGIEDAIKVISEVNNIKKRIIYTLDIYGPIDKSYEKEFFYLINKNSQYISYKGIIKENESIEIIKNYLLLLFPTRFKTEGIPGTIIDSLSAGVPVIASKWEAVDEILNNEIAFLYEMYDLNKFKNILLNLSENVDKIYDMKVKCLKESKKYRVENTINLILEDLR